jgi:transposase
MGTPMTPEEARAIAYGDPEQIVEVLLRLSAEIDQLKREVAFLTRNSTNSSKPPSSDGPAVKLRPRRPKKSKKRNPGGQPGHKGTNRDLIPIDEVVQVIPVFPQACDHCGASLNPDPDKPTGKYWRHPVIDIPDPKQQVAEYQLQCIRCNCGTENWGKIPQAARSGFGPRLTAFLAHLTGLLFHPTVDGTPLARDFFAVDGLSDRPWT